MMTAGRPWYYPYNRATSFLDLPSHLRHTIYHDAEIYKDSFISLSRGDDRSVEDSDKTTHSLLLTSRTVYEEVAAEVYGNNLIYIRYGDQNSLDALRRLRPTAMHALTNLTVHLNVTSCGLGRPCEYFVNPWNTAELHSGDQLLSVSGSSSRVRTLCQFWKPKSCWHCSQNQLEEWYSVWYKNILPILNQPAKLRLSFICDVADLETGRVAVRPFSELPNPRLLDCSIRLSRWPVSDLSKLAQESVVHSVAKPNDTPQAHIIGADWSLFRFTHLPFELRQHILTYTDLVAPYTEVEWNADHGHYCRDRRFGHGDEPDTLHGSSFDDESMEHRTADYKEDNSPCDVPCWERSYPLGCFCRARHAAFSSSVHCNCWAPPKSLFLVSRSVREDALSVFYSRNSFVIAPTGGRTWKAVSTAPHQLPPSIFLNRIVPKDALRHLRDLEIVFPPFGEDEPCDYCPRDSPQFLDWDRTLKQVKPYLDFPKLTIRIHFAGWQPHGNSCATNDYRGNMTSKQAHTMCMTYLRTVAPLRHVCGLRKFFAYFAWPQEWVAYGKGHERYKYCQGRGQKVMHVLESRAEELLMGSEYVAVSEGKFQQKESRWLAQHRERRYW